MKQIAVRGVNLDGIKAQTVGAGRCRDEAFAYLRQIVVPEFVGGCFPLLERDRAGSHRLPAAVEGRYERATLPRPAAGALPTGVAELDRERYRRDTADHPDHAPEGLFAGVVIEAETTRCDPAALLNRGGLQNQQPRAAQRELPQVGEMPSLGTTVDRLILSHGGNHHPVWQPDRSQGQGFEQSDGHERGSGGLEIGGNNPHVE
jgi:hypothetical protein